MTKEEIIKHLHEALNSVDITFPYRYVFVEAIEAISRPSLPSNLDDAAKEYADHADYDYAECNPYNYTVDAVKFGVEWMAGQFQKIDGELVDWYETKGVNYCYGISTNESFEVPEGFYIKKK